MHQKLYKSRYRGISDIANSKTRGDIYVAWNNGYLFNIIPESTLSRKILRFYKLFVASFYPLLF